MSATIKSRNKLFRGQVIRKPPLALVVGYDPDEVAIYCCPKCGHRDTAEGCDIIGAEPGCLFCLQCNTEFQACDE